MKAHISDALRGIVIARAAYRCEYCLLHHNHRLSFPHEVDHIVAEKHYGETNADNLAYACFYCNRHKGSDLASTDPLTKRVVLLFNPRIDLWSEHFAIHNASIVSLTDVGRATVRLLRMNRPASIQHRSYLIQLGLYP